MNQISLLRSGGTSQGGRQGRCAKPWFAARLLPISVEVAHLQYGTTYTYIYIYIYIYTRDYTRSPVVTMGWFGVGWVGVGMG